MSRKSRPWTDERNGVFSSTTIRQCLSGCHKTHKGFTFVKITADEYKELTGEYEDVKLSFLKILSPNYNNISFALLIYVSYLFNRYRS